MVENLLIECPLLDSGRYELKRVMTANARWALGKKDLLARYINKKLLNF